MKRNNLKFDHYFYLKINEKKKESFFFFRQNYLNDTEISSN